MIRRIKRLSSSRKKAGFTLIEMLVAVLIATLVFAVVGKLLIYTARSFLALGNYNDLDQASQNALDVISREIRQTQKLGSFKTNQLVFQNFNGLTNLSYSWNPATRILTRTNGAQVTTLLRECDYLSLNISQRNASP